MAWSWIFLPHLHFQMNCRRAAHKTGRGTFLAHFDQLNKVPCSLELAQRLSKQKPKQQAQQAASASGTTASGALPQLGITSRHAEIRIWTAYREELTAWLCLLDDRYAEELSEAASSSVEVAQSGLTAGKAARCCTSVSDSPAPLL